MGDPQARPPEAYGLDNFADLARYGHIFANTVTVAVAATVMAVLFGFVMAWILSRTNVPGRAALEQLMALPYYVTPLMGALAWSLIGSPSGGFLNQVWRALGGEGHLIDMTTPYGIAWVMALFEGSVAFVMIGAVMKSMDPALEEASQVLGAGRLRTMLRITLPLVLPGVLGAAIFVFAEMLGSFSAALVLGLPNRFYVVTTAMYQLVSQYPPQFPRAAAMGVSLFAVMFAMVYVYRRVVSRGNYVTITGKAFRPRVMERGPPALVAPRGLRGLSGRGGDPARPRPALRLHPAARHRLPQGRQLHAGELPDRAVARRGALRALEQPAPRRGHRQPRRADHGVPRVDDLPLPPARRRRHRVRADVPAGGPPAPPSCPALRREQVWYQQDGEGPGRPHHAQDDHDVPLSSAGGFVAVSAPMVMAGLVFALLWAYAATHFAPFKADAVVFPGAALLWLGAAFYLAMLGLVAEVALSSERESAREVPTAWEVR